MTDRQTETETEKGDSDKARDYTVVYYIQF